jgi:hypothetical protein
MGSSSFYAERQYKGWELIWGNKNWLANQHQGGDGIEAIRQRDTISPPLTYTERVFAISPQRSLRLLMNSLFSFPSKI